VGNGRTRRQNSFVGTSLTRLDLAESLSREESGFLSYERAGIAHYINFGINLLSLQKPIQRYQEVIALLMWKAHSVANTRFHGLELLEAHENNRGNRHLPPVPQQFVHAYSDASDHFRALQQTGAAGLSHHIFPSFPPVASFDASARRLR
jgi:hypothetical protein